MIKRCPGCRRLFLLSGGKIRFVDEDSPEGYFELRICRKCARELEETVPSRDQEV